MINMNKQYRTRSGLSVRVLCVDAKSDYPVVAAVYDGEKERVLTFTAPGSRYKGSEDDWDLVEVDPWLAIEIGEPVMVRDSDYGAWVPRYYAGLRIGPTTWSTEQLGVRVRVPWNQCRRPTQEEIASRFDQRAQGPRSDDVPYSSLLLAVDFMFLVLRNYIVSTMAKELADELSHKALAGITDGIVVLERYQPWMDIVCQDGAAKLVLYPDSTSGTWRVQTVPIAPGSFESRVELPAAWAGLKGPALDAVTGADPGATFCHKERSIAGHKTRDGAFQMACAALNI